MIQDEIKKRILILDGAMGTAIQHYGLTEADFRGSEFISVAELQLDPVAVGLTLRIFRPLLRKERQQHLLGGVFIVVTGKI